MSPTRRPVCLGITRAVLCTVLLSGLSSCLHDYYLIKKPKTWSEAQKYCRENYADLASVDSIEDMERLVAAASSGYEGTVWIGLHDKFWDWRWSMVDDGFYEEENKPFSRWEDGQPNEVSDRGEICGAVKQGLWHDYHCDLPLPFLCYNNTLGSLTASSERYVFINEAKTWHEARAYCRLHHTDLASVRNKMESMVIQKVLPSKTMVSVGLHRPTWVWWSDGTTRSFKHWKDKHPASTTASCAASGLDPKTRGRWVEESCDTLLHFVCREPRKQQFHLKLTALNSTVDLNDPAVTEAILTLMEKNMRDKGVEGDFKIVWKRKPDNKIFHKEVKNTDLEKTDV